MEDEIGNKSFGIKNVDSDFLTIAGGIASCNIGWI